MRRWLPSLNRGGRERQLTAIAGCVATVSLWLCARGVLAGSRHPRPALIASVADRSRAVQSPPIAAEDEISAARSRLTRFETERRRVTAFAQLPPANRDHGADPYALARLDARHLVGVLRGSSAIVLLDTKLHELQRIEVDGSPVSVAVTDARNCWVAGETTRRLRRVRFDGRTLRLAETLDVPGVAGLRALDAGPSGLLYALDGQGGQLLTVRPGAASLAVLDARAVGHGPLSLRHAPGFLVVDVLLDHALVVYRLNARGEVLQECARITHDGPIWGFDVALLASGELAVAATGVEDHPLDRGDGGFGYIDSFAFYYLLPKTGPARRLWSVNTSELGVVTPKAPLLTVNGARARLFVSGYGDDRAAELEFPVLGSASPTARSEVALPGVSAALRLDAGSIAFADPLLDAWVLRSASSSPERAGNFELRAVDAVPAQVATPEERLGEALLFTTLIAPSNTSAGARSRFTCEACHFEGYVDGRVHYTGRGDVHATTKPLRGLFNNRPHFSRALDADLETVAHHEFRVAGHGNGADPWFPLEVARFPWLAELGVRDSRIEPEGLRRAFMAFLMGFTHTPNPSVAGRSHYGDAEGRGAELFRELCLRCHAARLESDVPNSALAFESWPAAIFSAEGPIVWASADYQKTGVTPYVHDSGTRVPSLRRSYAKWPYFTNGSALTLTGVLERVRYDDARLFHDHAPDDPGLCGFSATEIAELTAFLELL